MQRIIVSACLLVIAALALGPPRHADMLTASAQAVRTRSPAEPPLPLAVPYHTLMTGMIGGSAFLLFQLVGKPGALNSDEWAIANSAASDMSALATLLSLEGTNGPDSQKFHDPDWRSMVGSMHKASAQVARSVLLQDQTAFNRSVTSLAESCQACHAHFLVAQPEEGTQIAN